MSRYGAATIGEWERDSLVGSHFLGEGFQGCVVAEPFPAVYLCELLSWISGDSTDQELIPLDRMINNKWLFYDTAEERNRAYHERISAQWEAERNRTEGEPE